MYSIILSSTTRIVTPLLLLFSFFLLIRGHNEPGGGFVGGLVAATAFLLYLIAFGVLRVKRLLRIEPLFLIALGLLITLVSSLFGLFFQEEFMKGFWLKEEIPILGKFGTPFLFDIGVYFLVIGVILKIIFSLAEEDKD
ncbi:MAG: Na(+)/H(+) antiporter subunit B [Chlorobiaceae bacterium]|nr:Na(+)/H(+) antiporter subunit B [Chlorobiaceae bacterium]MBA4310213.1 Na(+)/H(+) antiporter subunit B [Chlorobiaceae bacterium]